MAGTPGGILRGPALTGQYRLGQMMSEATCMVMIRSGLDVT